MNGKHKNRFFHELHTTIDETLQVIGYAKPSSAYIFFDIFINIGKRQDRTLGKGAHCSSF